MSRINKKFNTGFIATTAVLLLALGGLIFSLTTAAAILMYADSIDARESRIQKNLNVSACNDTLALITAKDYFLQGKLYLSDFDCSI